MGNRDTTTKTPLMAFDLAINFPPSTSSATVTNCYFPRRVSFRFRHRTKHQIPPIDDSAFEGWPCPNASQKKIITTRTTQTRFLTLKSEFEGAKAKERVMRAAKLHTTTLNEERKFEAPKAKRRTILRRKGRKLDVVKDGLRRCKNKKSKQEEIAKPLQALLEWGASGFRG